jgi:probable F420-dependent oxidoreductase
MPKVGDSARTVLAAWESWGMRLGVFGINSGTTFGPSTTLRFARRCEELGYESWWAGEHVVLPSPRVAPAPMKPTDPILDPLVHLAFVAAATERMLLGTGIIILPQRHPLVLAKQIASLDVLSGGRFVFGVGVGYLGPELEAIGVPMSERASRTDDHLAAMRAIWYDEGPVAFDGAHTHFAGLDAHPRPTGVVPIVVGGQTAGAHRRAIEQGNGWYGFFLTPTQAAEQIAGLRAAADRSERPAALGPLEISITPPGPVTEATVREYADAGVDRLIVYPVGVREEDAVERFLVEQAALVLG